MTKRGRPEFFVMFYDKSKDLVDYDHVEKEDDAKEFLMKHFFAYLNRLPREWFYEAGFEDVLAPNEEMVLHPEVVYEFELLMDMVEERINELGEEQDMDYDFSVLDKK